MKCVRCGRSIAVGIIGLMIMAVIFFAVEFSK